MTQRDRSTLAPISKGRLYEQVIVELRKHAAAVGLRTGSRLPPERELAERLGVSRASVAQAVVALEVQGLVETRHGGGVYLLRDTLETEPIADLLARKERLPDVLDARDGLETKFAELAARRRTKKDIDRIDEALARMRSQVAQNEVPLEADRLFHAAVVQAARSPILAAFYDRISDQIAESRRESLRQVGRPAESLRDHEGIAAAIRAKDHQAAVEAMRAHLSHVSQVRLLSWEPGPTAPDSA